MSRSLRLFVRLMAALLVIAIAAPFYLKGPGGRPLLTLDRFTRELTLPSAVAEAFEDDAPVPQGTDKLRVEGSAVYRWKDQYGIWQFGEAPPEGIEAETMEMESSITPLGADWQVDDARETASQSPAPTATPGNPLDAYAQAPELIDRAKQVVEQVKARNEQLSSLTAPRSN